MADETTDPIDSTAIPETAIDPNAEQGEGWTKEADNERKRRRLRFAELGGGKLLAEDIKKAGKLEDVITDVHRRLIHDMAAGDLSHESIARIVGISKERLQKLFEYELGTGFELVHGSIIRTTAAKAVMGDMYAANIWLRNHNRSEWASKQVHHNLNENEPSMDGVDEASVNEAFMAGVIAGLQVDTKFKGEPRVRQVPKAVVQSASKVKQKAVVRKPKGD